MNYKIVLGIILPVVLILVLVTLGSTRTGFIVKEELIESISIENLVSSQYNNRQINIGQVRIENNYFIPRREELPLLQACFFDREGVSVSQSLGYVYYIEDNSRKYTKDDLDPISLVLTGKNNMQSTISVEVPANSNKTVTLALNQPYYYDYYSGQESQGIYGRYSNFDEIVIIERKSSRDYLDCSQISKESLNNSKRIILDFNGQKKLQQNKITTPTSYLNLDGSSYYISTQNVSAIDTSFTVHALIKSNSPYSNNFAISHGVTETSEGFHLGYRDSRKFTCAFFGNDLDTYPINNNQEWHSWACTYDTTSKQRKLYLDGVLIASDTANGDYHGEGNLYLGKGLSVAPFKGDIDDFYVWTRALSSDEINKIINSTQSQNLKNEAAIAFNFDSVSGDSITDLTGRITLEKVIY